jgi:hypothetical protein
VIRILRNLSPKGIYRFSQKTSEGSGAFVKIKSYQASLGPEQQGIKHLTNFFIRVTKID